MSDKSIHGFLLAVFLLFLVSGAVTGRPARAQSAADKSTPAAESGYRAVSVIGGVVEGTVALSGKPKKRPALAVDHDKEVCGLHPIRDESLVVSADGGVANAVVYIEGIAEGKFWTDSPIVMDQIGCAYTPHVLAVGVGQKILFKNSDPVLHNINTFPKENRPVNLSLLAAGQGRPVARSFKFPDVIKVTCDAHKWMSAWIVVRDNPYFAVTDKAGRFRIGAVPPGTYRVQVWSEGLGVQDQSVAVVEGKTVKIKFILKEG